MVDQDRLPLGRLHVHNDVHQRRGCASLNETYIRMASFETSNEIIILSREVANHYSTFSGDQRAHIEQQLDAASDRRTAPVNAKVLTTLNFFEYGAESQQALVPTRTPPTAVGCNWTSRVVGESPTAAATHGFTPTVWNIRQYLCQRDPDDSIQHIRSANPLEK